MILAVSQAHSFFQTLESTDRVEPTRVRHIANRVRSSFLVNSPGAGNGECSKLGTGASISLGVSAFFLPLLQGGYVTLVMLSDQQRSR